MKERKIIIDGKIYYVDFRSGYQDHKDYIVDDLKEPFRIRKNDSGEIVFPKDELSRKLVAEYERLERQDYLKWCQERGIDPDIIS